MERDDIRREVETGERDIERAILLGATAAACRIWAIEAPLTAPGMTKAADSYSEQAAGLLTKWAEGQ